MAQNKSDISTKKLTRIELELKHLKNELSLVNNENITTNDKYYSLFNDMEKEVKRRSLLIKEQNKKLKDEITKRKIIEKELKDTLKEKDFLMQEIHHRVKNNLQIISSLLNLQLKQTEDNKTHSILTDSRNRIQSLALIHEKIYQSENLNEFNLSTYINTLSVNIFRSFMNNASMRTLNVDIKNDCYADLDICIPCGLVINEIITNSIKHAFPENQKGIISLTLESDKNTLNIIVSDNGIGIPKDIIVEESKSLGLHLIKLLTINQLKGKIDINTENGTKFNISIPLKRMY